MRSIRCRYAGRVRTDERPVHDEDEASSRPKKKRHPVVAFLGELPGLILMAFALALLIKSLLLQAFWIPTGSMEPTLVPGDRVIVAKVPYFLHDPARGDIIVFEEPDPAKAPERGVWGGVTHWLGQGLGFSPPDDPDYIKRGDRGTGGRRVCQGRPCLRERASARRALPGRTDRPLPQDEGSRGGAVRDGRQPSQLPRLSLRARIRADRPRDREGGIVIWPAENISGL